MSEALKQMRDRLAVLEAEVAKLSTRERIVADDAARILILDLIGRKKKEGIRELDAFDIKNELHLPFIQISTIMETLEEESLVHGKI